MKRGRALGPGRLKKEGTSWVLIFTDEHGDRKRWVVGRDKRTAERRRTAIIARRDMAIDGLGAIAGMDMALAEVVDAYLLDLEPRVTDLHYKNVRGSLARVVAELGDTCVRDITIPRVVRLRSEAVKAGAANRTANLIVDRIKSALKWAVEAGLIAESPIRNVRRLPEKGEHQRRKRRALSEDEIHDLLEASREDDEENELAAALQGITRVPQTPLWQTIIEAGPRWNEIRQAEWGDVDLSQGTLLLREENTKTRKQRSIPIRAELGEVLKALRALHETILGRLPTITDRVFLTPEGCNWAKPTTNAMRILDRLLDRAGIAKIRADGRRLDIQALRKTANTRMLRNGVPLTYTQQILGHADPKLTAQAYTDLNVEDLRPAVSSLPSLNASRATKAKEA